MTQTVALAVWMLPKVGPALLRSLGHLLRWPCGSYSWATSLAKNSLASVP
jgi:hypothetical protein